MPETESTSRLGGAWVGRVRLALAVGLVWVGLHYVAEARWMPPGVDRPVVVMGATGGVLAVVVVGALLLIGGYLGPHIAGSGRTSTGLLVVGLALAVWAAPGGTMDDWLKLKLPLTTQPPGPAYWALLGDYLFLLACVAGVLILGEFARLGTRVNERAARSSGMREALGFDSIRAEFPQGLLALLTTALIGAIALLFLTGPRDAATHRGQVYFAVLVGFYFGALAATRVSKARHPVWYLAAPFIVGIIGVVVAGSGLRLPGLYSGINIIPTIGLVRALPVELISVGSVGVLWALHSLSLAKALDSETPPTRSLSELVGR